MFENHYFRIVILIGAFLGIVLVTQPAYSMTNFNSIVNLSHTSGTIDQQSQQVVTSGSNVYVTWDDGTHVYFVNSTDNGATFPWSAITVDNNAGTHMASFPSISLSGNQVIIAWVDYNDNQIYYRNSTTAGGTFPSSYTATKISTGSDHFDSPVVTVSGTRISVAWVDTSGTIKGVFERSTTDGKTFGSQLQLSSNSAIAKSFSLKSQSSGSDVYLVWTDTSGGSSHGEIYFVNSTDNGNTFPWAAVNLSRDTSDSINPTLAAAGNDVYIAWSDNSGTGSNYDIFLESSTNNGVTFNVANGGTHGTPGSSVNISSSTFASENPQAVASGSNLFLIWEEKHSGGNQFDVFYKKVTSDGSNFDNANVNLSNDLQSAEAPPQIAVSSSDVYVTWQDNVLSITTPVVSEIFFRSSEDSGSTFSGFLNLSHTKSTDSTYPVIAASGTHPYVAWQEGSSQDVYFKSGTIISRDFALDAVQYKVNSTATITFTNPSKVDGISGQTMSVTVNSTSSPSGVPVTLTESGDTGKFSGTLTMTNQTVTPSGQLKVHGGDSIQAVDVDDTYGTQSAYASIFKSKIAFDFLQYDRGTKAHITVTDPGSNKDPYTAEKITITISSTSNPNGVPLTLTETGTDTGIFGGTLDTQSSLYFGVGFSGSIPSGSGMTISQTDSSANTHADSIDTTTVTVQSSSDTSFSLTLQETGVNTGIFTGRLTLTSGTADHANGIAKAIGGDILKITHGTLTSNSVITPNSVTSTGIVEVDSPPETVKASYQGLVATATIVNGGGEGGGGGGLVRPGLVLDVLAAIGGSNSVAPSFSLASLAAIPGALPDNIRQEVLHQDPNKPLEPKHDSFDYPLSIDGGGYLLGRYTNKISTVTEKTNTPMDLKLNIPATNLQHLALYTNLHGAENDLTKSDTYIIYDKDSPLQIVDPHHYFDHVKFDLTTEGVKNKIDYSITFANPMDKSNIVLRAWNDRHSSNDVVVLDAWQAVDNQKLTSSSESSPLEEAQIQTPPNSPTVSPVESKVPSWVQNNAKLWTAGSIGDSEFETGIQYLISEKIINIQKQTVEPSESDTIPIWVKNTAKFWVNGDVTEDEFLHSIEYLVKLGLIKVS